MNLRPSLKISRESIANQNHVSKMYQLDKINYNLSYLEQKIIKAALNIEYWTKFDNIFIIQHHQHHLRSHFCTQDIAKNIRTCLCICFPIQYILFRENFEEKTRFNIFYKKCEQN